MKDRNLSTIFSALIAIALVAGITIAAIYFNRPAILWWYIVPALMGLEVDVKGD